MISQQKVEYIRSFADRDGFIEPAALVNDARRPDSVLHDEFEWDIGKAAELQWLDRARKLINFVRIEVTIEHREIRAAAFVIDPKRPAGSKRYIALSVAKRDRERAIQIVQDEASRICAAVQRAKNIASVLGLDAELDKLLACVNEIIAAVETIDKPKRKKPKHKEDRVGM